MLNGFLINRTTRNRVPIGDHLVIGRGVDADLCIDDRVASRSHVEITKEKMGYCWRDLGSRNGTLINGVHETGGKLRDGDHLRIGETDLIFELEVEGRRIERLREPVPFEATLMNAAVSEEVLPDLRKTCELLDTVYKVMGQIAANYDACRLQDRILDTALPAINAQRGALFLANEMLEITPCPLCGRIHSYVDGQLSHAEKDGLNISNSVAHQVLRDGKSVFYKDCDSGEGAEPSASMISLALRSIICVPLLGKSRILGILYIDTNRPGQHYGQEDLLLASAVGASAGIALENVFLHRELLEKQRMDQEIETAWAIQEGFLCREWEVKDGRFEVFGDTLPAKTVGGDFYDFMMPDKDTACLLIGDVSGKGVPAALTMAQLLAEFRMLVKDIPSPADLLKRLNNGLVRRSRRGMFCTMTYARLDLRNGTLVWANAGHLPALFISPDTNAYKGEASGPPLGVVEEAAWSDDALILDPGTTLLYFTDGIIEAHPHSDDAEEFGLGRLWGTPEYGITPKYVLEDVNDALKSYLKGAEAHDDCTMISLRYLGSEYDDDED